MRHRHVPVTLYVRRTVAVRASSVVRIIWLSITALGLENGRPKYFLARLVTRRAATKHNALGISRRRVNVESVDSLRVGEKWKLAQKCHVLHLAELSLSPRLL